MKSIISFSAIILLNRSGDMFSKEEYILGSCKINNSISIDLHYIGLGATTRDVIQVQKKTTSGNTLVKKREGFNDTYKVEIKPVDDSLLKITFTDTIDYKGQSKDFIVNLNEKVRELK